MENRNFNCIVITLAFTALPPQWVLVINTEIEREGGWVGGVGGFILNLDAYTNTHTETHLHSQPTLACPPAKEKLGVKEVCQPTRRWRMSENKVD